MSLKTETEWEKCFSKTRKSHSWYNVSILFQRILKIWETYY